MPLPAVSPKRDSSCISRIPHSSHEHRQHHFPDQLFAWLAKGARPLLHPGTQSQSESNRSRESQLPTTATRIARIRSDACHVILACKTRHRCAAKVKKAYRSLCKRCSSTAAAALCVNAGNSLDPLIFRYLRLQLREAAGFASNCVRYHPDKAVHLDEATRRETGSQP